jgi:hypothetical protein
MPCERVLETCLESAMSGLQEKSKGARKFVEFEVEGITVRESGRFVARCAKLRLSATGEDADSALERWKSVFAAYLDSCERRGTLLDVLENAGIQFRIVSSGPERTETINIGRAQDGESFNVIPFLRWGVGNDAGSSEAAR